MHVLLLHVKLKIKKKDGYWNYDSSEFDTPAPLLEDDDALEGLWKKQYSLAAVVAADQFKSYDDLKKRLDYVLGHKKAPQRPRFDEEVATEDEARNVATKQVEAATTSTTVDSDEDDALSYFQKLAEA